MDERLGYLGFSIFPGIGPAKFQMLLEQFETAEKAWNESQESLSGVLGEKLAGELVDFRKKFDPKKYAKELEEKKIGWVALVDDEYPRLLKEMTPTFVISSAHEKSQSIDKEGFWTSPRYPNGYQNDKNEIATSSYGEIRNDETTSPRKKHHPPFVVFYKGNSSLFSSEKTIGIVGTRSISQYGREVTEMLTRGLVEQGFVIVSGLALGVDGVAHETCLNNSGKTIAVLGSGVDICTPANHQNLYDRILAEDGLIVSTVPPGEEPNKGSFPARNKIIAGLSLGVILTEGTADSGALYTADFATDMGRPVFSVPGPITSRLSAATTQLLKNGAIAITSADDVVKGLGILEVRKTRNNQKIRMSDDPEEQQILDLLARESLHFNDLARKLGKTSQDIASMVSIMELKGMIGSASDGTYYIL